MSNRYLVAVSSSTKPQNDSFIDFINSHGLAWWHWIDNFWLIVDRAGKLDVEKLREGVGNSFPGVHHLVIEQNANGDIWAGFGPKSEERNMFKWLHETWSKKGDSH